MKRDLAPIVLGLAIGCRQGQVSDDCLTIEGAATPVGIDATFSLTARLVCPELQRGRVRWRQLAGPELREASMADDGYRFTARTPKLGDIGPRPLPWGVIPLSPATRGEVILEVTWTDGRRQVRRETHVAAAARSRGLTNLAVGARVFLGGGGWRFTARPPDSATVLDVHPDFASFEPDARGDFRLADGRGQPLVVRAGRYDETPLDCGRSGCHPTITDSTTSSPMTTVLARGLARIAGSLHPAFGAGYPGCALACHATGEPGLADGGFMHVAATLGVTDVARPWDELPRPLRRLGGVGCLACHGPAALPPPSARAAILRADVCAICHDAPPRYGHVAAWRTTAMARADRDPRTRTGAACARCHTTAGLLDRGTGSLPLAVPRAPLASVGKASLRSPHGVASGVDSGADGAPVTGIACAACHDPHAHGGSGPRPPALLRTPAPPAVLGGITVPVRSAVCVGCHAPGVSDETPAASAAALFYGRGGLDPVTGRPLPGPLPHGRVENACTGCHRVGPQGLERGGGHGFGVSAAGCKACHAQPPPQMDFAERARRLWTTWRARVATDSDAGPVHATGVRPDLRSPLGRAAWDILLVLEDRGAGAHNAPYARALLAAAEQTLTGMRGRAAGAPAAPPGGGTP